MFLFYFVQFLTRVVVFLPCCSSRGALTFHLLSSVHLRLVVFVVGFVCHLDSG